MRFDCPRTCPLVGEAFCRFGPVLDQLGPVRANSHTVRVRVEYTDPDALRAAVESMGGQWIGPGDHILYRTEVVGAGFRLPGWTYPCVLHDSGELAFDSFGGRWGNEADLERLKGEYALVHAERAAQAQGWLCERTASGLTVYHPGGGTLTVTPQGVIDACGFHGEGCHDAILALSPGTWQDVQVKPEYGQVGARVQLQE